MGFRAAKESATRRAPRYGHKLSQGSQGKGNLIWGRAGAQVVQDLMDFRLEAPAFLRAIQRVARKILLHSRDSFKLSYRLFRQTQIITQLIGRQTRQPFIPAADDLVS